MGEWEEDESAEAKASNSRQEEKDLIREGGLSC